MRTAILKMGSIFLFLAYAGAGCDDDHELSTYQAEGTIIEVTGGCYGEIVLIEVEKPNGIGLSGTFSPIGQEAITYTNAIGVPYFSKTGIPDSVPQTVGTRLNFEYRELTEEEKSSRLFLTDPPILCPAIYGSPSVAYFIITKIIRYD